MCSLRDARTGGPDSSARSSAAGRVKQSDRVLKYSSFEEKKQKKPT